MRLIRARLPVRGLSLVVFAVLTVGCLSAFVYARRLEADQERRLLVQRAGEAAALLTNLVTQSSASTRALAAVARATNDDPQLFAGAADRDPAVAGGTATAALVSVWAFLSSSSEQPPSAARLTIRAPTSFVRILHSPWVRAA